MARIHFKHADAKRIFDLAVEHKQEVCFVKDDGIYLMVPNMKGIDPDANDHGISVVYAHGADPKQDEDCWETARFLAGGDDFGETFDETLVAKLQKQIADDALKYFVVDLKPETMQFVSSDRLV